MRNKSSSVKHSQVEHVVDVDGVSQWMQARIREEIVRCRDCAFFHRNATPHDESQPHFCSALGIDLGYDDGFCAWSERSES